jgi:zinc transport system ATP-binding protein
MMSEALLRSEALEVGYRGVALLPPIDLAISAGELIVVIGRNGAGKSTWFKTMVGLIAPVRGRVVRSGPDLRLAYVPQRADLDPLFPLSARDIVQMGLDRRWGFARPRLREPPAVLSALDEVDAVALANRPFRSLSEGQKARIVLARMIASRPRVAFLDEPTAAMDAVAERSAFELLDQLRQRHGIAIVVVSHYLGIAKEFATRAVFFDRDCGSVVTGSPDDVFAHADFHRSYGREAEALQHG